MKYDEVVIQCYQSYGRDSFRFHVEDEEWTITIMHQDAIDNNIIESVTRTKDREYGAEITLTESVCNWKICDTIAVDRDTSREIWSELIDRGFKPTGKTQKLIDKRA